MLHYSQPELTDRLARLPPPQRLAFAMACCERLFPLYQLYNEFARYGNAVKLRGVIDKLWVQLLGSPPTPVVNVRDHFEAFVDLESGRWTPLTELADDCVAAVCYAIECNLDGGPEHAMHAAFREIDAVDYLVSTLFEIGFSEPDDEAAILSNPLMQETLQRQDRDLGELTQTNLTVAWLRGFRMRAEAESARMLEGSRQLLDR